MKTDPRLTHYKVLMLAEIADQEIISTVYRKLAQRYHPDVDPSPEAARRMAAHLTCGGGNRVKYPWLRVVSTAPPGLRAFLRRPEPLFNFAVRTGRGR